jgi:hypothetical protein
MSRKVRTAFNEIALSDALLPVVPLGNAQRAELQRQGAKAAARGDDRKSNPMGSEENAPEHTGEAHEAWVERRDAWDQGHNAQSGTLPTPEDKLACHAMRAGNSKA